MKPFQELLARMKAEAENRNLLAAVQEERPVDIVTHIVMQNKIKTLLFMVFPHSLLGSANIEPEDTTD